MVGLGDCEIAILGAAAFATSMLSAVVGMAGGITLLAIMLVFLDPLVAIPLHGAIQLVSNSSRALIQRQHLRWGIITRYGALLLPMGFLGLPIARTLPPAATKVVIGLFVLVATWRPGALLLGTRPEASHPNRRFFVLGGVVGLLNVTIGATGPLIAPFFLRLGLDRFQVVGTKAACQTLGHLAKLVVFGVTGFAFGAFVPLLAMLAALVVLGTWLGSRLLEHLDERFFVFLYRGVLSAIALYLIARQLAP